MVLISAIKRWSHVCLLSTYNLVFVRLLTQIIQLRAQFLDYIIRSIHLDNVSEFYSQAFNGYCMLIEIIVEHPIIHVHTQNELT